MSICLRTFWKSDRGNVAIMSAAVAPLLLATIALAVDYGSLSLQKRQLQMTADLAAIAAASRPEKALSAAEDYFADNGQAMTLKSSLDSKAKFDAEHVSMASRINKTKGVAEVTPGLYTADPALDVDSRFVASSSEPNAARVRLYQTGNLFFASSFASPPLLSAEGTAANQNLAAFSVGSRLASVHGGVLNKVLGALIGSSVDLNVMDYNALVDADVDLLGFSRSLATQLKLTGVTYADVLKANVTWPQFLTALQENTTGNAAKSALKTLAATKSGLRLPLSRTIDLGPYASLAIENVALTNAKPVLRVKLIDVLMSTLTAANGNRQISFDLDGMIVGLGDIKVSLAIGERPVETPALRVGEAGSSVRTAQTRLSVDIGVNGLSSLAGTTIHIPIYLEAAYAQAKLSAIYCPRNSTNSGSVEIRALPGIAELFVGKVDQASLVNFDETPRITRADLIVAPLVTATGYAHVAATNVSPSTLSFSSDDIRRGAIKTVSTRNAVETMVTTALTDMDMTISVGKLSVVPSSLLKDSIGKTLEAAAEPIDELVFDLAAALGIRVGEADLRVTDLVCNRAVLVQ